MAGGAKLAFAFVKDEAEVEMMRDLRDEAEDDMVKAEAPAFWVEWPNFEWMDEQAAKEEEDEEEEAKRERSEEKDREPSVREKRRRVVVYDEDE